MYACRTAGGSGSGTVWVDPVASVRLTPGTATTDLYPGMSGDVAVSIANSMQSNGGAGWFVPAGATPDLDLANAVELGIDAASEYQDATFIVYLLAAP